MIQCSNRGITPLGAALGSKHPLPQPYIGKEVPKVLRYILFNVCKPCKMKISEFDKFGTNTHKQVQDFCTAQPVIIFTAFMAQGSLEKKKKQHGMLSFHTVLHPQLPAS